MDMTVQEPENIKCREGGISSLEGPIQDYGTVPFKKIRRKHLINKLNHLNFSEKPVNIVFSTADFTRHLHFEGYVSPCSGTEFAVRIADVKDPGEFFRYRLEYISFKTSTGRFRFTPSFFNIAENGITVDIPSFGEQYGHSDSSYTKANGCTGKLFQNAVEIPGAINSYTSDSFIFKADSDARNGGLINPNMPVHVVIANASGTVFSGDCSITWREPTKGIYHLYPETHDVNRFPSREYRSARIILDNLPQLGLTHPLSGTYMEFRIHDISGTGFSISNRTAMLFPGLRVDDAVVAFPEGTKLICTIQVIHGIRDNEDNRVGLGILDIDPRDHLKLLSVLHQARDANAFLCKKINLQRLMEFFFDSGFIYPEKYLYLQKHRTKILSIYQKLYNTDNNIARHFIYQKGDQILGHLAMVRFYEKSWLIHHHASATEGGMNAGIHVLNQATSFITDSYRFHGMNLHYILCFFRPENRFPKRVFGGLVPRINDKQQCSIDDFAYFHIGVTAGEEESAGGWDLEVPNLYDYQVLMDFYERKSGGLMLEAMDILPHQTQNEGVLKAFAEMDINRGIDLKVLKHNNQIAAFFIYNTSDPGLNMSDLTNNLMIIITNETILEKNILFKFSDGLLRESENTACPLLIYPKESVRNLGIQYEKIYQLWIIRSSLSDIYHEHVEQLFRGSLKNLTSQGTKND